MMHEPRIPLPSRKAMFAVNDTAASITAPDNRYARRFSLDIAEEALVRMGPRVVEHIAQRLGEQVVHRHHSDIESAVFAYLTDRAWAEPIIRAAIADSVRRIMFDMLNTPSPEEMTNV